MYNAVRSMDVNRIPQTAEAHGNKTRATIRKKILLEILDMLLH